MLGEVEEWKVCLGKRMILGGPLADRRTRQGRHRPNLIFFSLEIPFIKYNQIDIEVESI